MTTHAFMEKNRSKSCKAEPEENGKEHGNYTITAAYMRRIPMENEIETRVIWG